MPKVSIVIPSYQGVALFKKNLTAVLDCMRSGDELIIIDDQSGPNDQTLPWLSKKFSLQKQEFKQFAADFYLGSHLQGQKKLQIILLVNHHNQRFGETVNRGFRVAENELVFLINNDVAPHQDCLEHLLPHFQDQRVFAVGCLEYETKLGEIGGRNKLWFERGMFLHSRHEEFVAGETAWASGGSAMFRKSVFNKIGGFDRRYYPAYWEDIDLSFQARKLGYSILFEPKAKVDHNHETTNQSVFGQNQVDRISFRNARKFTWKNASFWQKISFLLWQPYWFIKMKQ